MEWSKDEEFEGGGGKKRLNSSLRGIPYMMSTYFLFCSCSPLSVCKISTFCQQIRCLFWCPFVRTSYVEAPSLVPHSPIFPHDVVIENLSGGGEIFKHGKTL